MSKTCAKCEKTVYPLEELKCLDKIWHKGCFKCWECGMTLNMKTYKGFNKFPYCEAHIPKAKATTVAETPELKRIQENTKIQSNAAYHADFEKSKGKFTPITDDPELMRIKQNTKIISNVAYHGDLEKKAMMEQKRNLGGEGDGNKNGMPPPRSPSSYMEELSSLPTSQPPPPAPVSHQQQQQYHHVQSMQQQQQAQPYGQSYNRSTAPSGYNSHDDHQPQQKHYSSSQSRHNVPQQQQSVPQYPSQHHQSSHMAPQYEQERVRPYQQHPQYQPQPQYQPPPQHYGHQVSSSNASLYSNRGQQNVIYTSDGGAVAGSPRKVGSISDYDPMNNYYGSMEGQQRAMQQQQSGRIPQGHGQQQQQHQGMRSQPVMSHQHQAPPQPHYATRYRALYDYDAQDVDEVSFLDSDLIIDSTPIEEGWLTGTVQRTGKRGMLPANYVAAL